MKTAYPLNSSPCSIRLFSNIPFDNTYKNHSLISEKFKYNNTQIYDGTNVSEPAKERFINRFAISTARYYPKYDLTGEFNFDFKNGLIGSITLELTAEQTNANYMRVKVGDALHGYEYYYYFITSIVQSNVDTYTLSLECDVLMTYQDELLDGLNNIPVFATRKHCHRFTSNGLMPFGADLKTGDSSFSNVKPSIIEKTYHLSHNARIKTIKDVVWLYICVDGLGANSNKLDNFKCQGITYPFSMFALPVNCGMILQASDGTQFCEYTQAQIQECIKKVLINNGSVHGAKLSHYPPFTTADANYITFSSNKMTIRAVQSTITGTSPTLTMDFKVGSSVAISYASRFTALNSGAWTGDDLVGAMARGCLLITEINNVNYNLLVPTDFKAQFQTSTTPAITENRLDDPKLLFSPFKKYVLSSKYSGDGVEIYPELLYSEFTTSTSTDYYHFTSISTPYLGDMSVYTYLESVSVVLSPADYAWLGYGENRIGLSGTMNYTMPVGQNALEVFNSTQATAFYQSKIASGITGGLAIAGGVASIVAGAGMTVGSSGALSPMGIGFVASGATAIAGGVSGIANSIASTNAKTEDLKNTPDSINVAGSSFISDYALNTNEHLPFISVYKVSSSVKENANDFFYNFGYEVARECYFNTELKYTFANHTTDNNIFGRSIFNYIQLNDDITNKINANIPLIIKQKLSKIFNDGITLWTFFGNTSLWKSTQYPTNTNNPDKWFMKCTLDNTEYSE